LRGRHADGGPVDPLRALPEESEGEQLWTIHLSATGAIPADPEEDEDDPTFPPAGAPEADPGETTEVGQN
jgi:hypothetical protein